MELSPDNYSVTEYKTLILYILYKVNKPLTKDEFLQLVLSVTDINYFYFNQFLLDLSEANYIESYLNEESILYKITSSGIEALKITGDMIPGILKLKVDNNFKNALAIIEDEVSVTADYMPKNEHSFIVRCRIVENSDIIFELKTFAGSIEQAKALVDNWKNNAVNIYPKIINILNDEQIH